MRDITDELPFDVPESWEWVRLGTIVEINPRNKLDDDIDVAFIPMPLIDDGYRNQHTFEVKKWIEVKSGFTHFAENDIAIAKITPCFENRKSAIMNELPNAFGAGTTELHILRTFGETLNRMYLLWFCKTSYFIDGGTKTYSGTADQQRIGRDYIVNCLFPLPPLSEQLRIITKLTEIMTHIDSYDKYEAQISRLNCSFPDQLKKSILQDAVRGKLVPQSPNDEPASILLERIRTEKEHMIIEGKIKRDRHESIIFRRDNSHYRK